MVSSDWRASLRGLLPFYLAIWAVAVCAFLALGSVLDERSIVPITLFVVTLGFATSLALRLVGVSRRAAPLLLGAGGVLLLLFLRSSWSGALMAGAGSVIASILPALFLGAFLLVFCFCLVDDDLLLFVIPPSLTILGLAGTENPNEEMTAYFLLFMIAAIFALSYHSYLQYVPPEMAGASPARLRPVLRWQIAGAAALFVLVALLTMVVALPLKDAGRVNAHRFRVPSADILSALGGLTYNAMGREMQMGLGTPALSERELFRVRSAEASYWRARTYDHYTGRGWADTTDRILTAGRPVPGSRLWATVLPRLGTPTPLGRRVNLYQEITFVASWPSRALPAAPDPALVAFEGDPGPLRVTRSDAVLINAPQLQAGLTYSVSSRVLQVDPSALRAVPDVDPDAPENRALAPYLRVPTSVLRVDTEVARVIAGLTNNFDRASAIESYLSHSYVYNLNVPPVPDDEDVVMHFLFTAREGYCDMFASAMAVMCRLANIPARVASGFISGTYDAATQTHVVREADAHAWVEVYFPGYGWVSFDPTPAASDTMLDAVDKGGVDLALQRLKRWFSFPVLILLTALALSAHLARLTLVDPWRRARRTSRGWDHSPAGAVQRAYHTACRRLRRHVACRPDQTPDEYLTAVAARVPEAAWLPNLETLTRLFLAARFGAAAITPEDAAAAQTALHAVLSGIRRQAWKP